MVQQGILNSRFRRFDPCTAHDEISEVTIMSKIIIPKVYLTQLALTSGVRVVHNMEAVEYTKRLISFKNESGYVEIHRKPHWHETRNDAVMQVEKMRQAKIKSAQKVLNKLIEIKSETIVPD